MLSRTKLTVLVGSAVLLTALLALGLASVSAAPGVDLVINKRSDPYAPGPVIAGEELFYHIDVYNSGDATATNVTVWDTLPPEVSYIGVTGGCSQAGPNSVVCYVDELEPGAYHDFEIKVYVPADAVAFEPDGTITIANTAVVSSDQVDDDPSDNTVTHSMFVEGSADLSVIKMSKPEFVAQAGEPFVYTIIVENLGPSFASGVALVDNIVSSGAFTMVGDPWMNRSGSCWNGSQQGYDGQVLFCRLNEPLEPKGYFALQQGTGGQWIIQLTVVANETQDVNNLVNVFTQNDPGNGLLGTPDPNLSNNSAQDFISVEDVADLSIDKYLDWCDGPDDQCVAGARVQFSVDVANNGPSTAENVVVEDLLPSGVTVVEVDGDGGCTTGIPGDPFAPLTCNLGSIPSGEGRSVNVVVQIGPDYVDAELPGDYRQLENDAWVYSDIFDPDNSNNRDYEMIDVYTYSALAITKWGFPAVAMPGEEAEYEIRIRNAGPSTVDMLHFVDLLPDAVIYQDYWIEQGTGTCTYHDSLPWPWWQDYRGVHCYVDEIAPEGVAIVHLNVQYSPDVHLYEDYFPSVCNVVPDDDPMSGEPDAYGVDDPFRMPGWFADSYITIPFENSPLYFDDEYFGWCPEGVFFDADLSIQKSVEPLKVYPGYEQLYHVQVTNNGPMDAPDVVVTDTLPSAVHYEIDNDNCDPVSEDPDVLECHLGTIPAGQTVAFDISVLVLPDAPPGEITNTALVTMPYDTNPDNNTASATNLVLEPTVADLSLEKRWEQAPPEWFETAPWTPEDCYFDVNTVRAGCPLRYVLTITNTGPLLAENVVVEDAIPAGVTVQNVWVSQGSCTTGIPGDPEAPLTCNLGSIPRDEGAGIDIFVMTDADLAWQPLENDAVVSSDIPDPNNGNNRAHVLNWIEPFSYLYLEKHGPPEITAGQEIEYWIDLNNDGPSTAHDVQLDDWLPGGVNLVSADVMIGDGSCAPGSALCSLGDMGPWEHKAVRVRGYVEPWMGEGTVITNTVQAWAGTPFFQPAPEQPISDTVETLVHSAADLAIWKSADPYKVFAGEQVRYDVSVSNNGPSVAHNVLVTDTLPSGVEYEISTVGCGGSPLTCPLGEIPPGETATFSIWVTVKPDTLGMITNEVTVSSDNDDTNNMGNNSYTEANLVLGKADLRVLKYGKPHGVVEAGERLTYTVIVDNLGPGYAHDVVLYDLFSSSSWAYYFEDWRSDRPADCSYDEWGRDTTITCRLDDPLEVMSPSSTGRWVLKFYFELFEEQSVNNVADVVGADFDPDLSNNHAITEHEITAVADLDLEKEAWGDVLVGCDGYTEQWENEVAAGGMLYYTLEIENDGPSEAENVVVEDWGLSPFLDIVGVECIKDDEEDSCSCNLSGLGELGDTNRHLVCYLGEIDEDDEDVIIITARIPSDVPEGTRLVNDARVYSDVFDDHNGDNLASNWTYVSRWADLEVEKTQDPEVVLPGQDITYSITVTNDGPSDAQGVIISDTLPVEVLNATWTCCASDGECDVPCEPPVCPPGECPWPDIGLFAQADIPADEWVIYTIEGTMDVWPCPLPITNTVEIIAPLSLVHVGEDIDPCDGNNVAEAVNKVPFCTYDPLVLKQYPGPDSPP